MSFLFLFLLLVLSFSVVLFWGFLGFLFVFICCSLLLTPLLLLEFMLGLGCGDMNYSSCCLPRGRIKMNSDGRVIPRCCPPPVFFLISGLVLFWDSFPRCSFYPFTFCAPLEFLFSLLFFSFVQFSLSLFLSFSFHCSVFVSCQFYFSLSLFFYRPAIPFFRFSVTLFSLYRFAVFL